MQVFFDKYFQIKGKYFINRDEPLIHLSVNYPE